MSARSLRAGVLSALATAVLLGVAVLAWAVASYTAAGPEAREGD